MGQNLVNGNKRTKGYFFTTTAVGDQRGYLFKNDDRPPELTFRDLLENIPFKSESSDQAQLDDFNSDIYFKAGLVCLATDAQVKALTAKPTDRALVVQPSQMTTEASVGVQNIGTASGPLNGQELVTVTEDNTVTTRKHFKVGFSSAFITWLVGVIDGIRASISGINTQITTINSTLTSLQNQITALSNATTTAILDSLPVGSMIWWPVVTPPTGKFLGCDNAAYNNVDYPELYALIGVTHGTAGAGTFRVPSTEGASLIPYKAADAQFGAIGNNGGVRTITLIEANLPPHQHAANGEGADIRIPSGGNHRHEIKWKGSGSGSGLNDAQNDNSGRYTEYEVHSHPNSEFAGKVGVGQGASTPINILNPYKVPGIVIIKALP